MAMSIYSGALSLNQGRDEQFVCVCYNDGKTSLKRCDPDQWFDLAAIIRHDALNRAEFKTGTVLGIVNVVDVRLAVGRPPTSWHDPGTMRSTAPSPAPSRRNYWWELSDAVLFDKPIEYSGQLMLYLKPQ